MEIFGIGPLELVFILILLVLILGPEHLVSGLRTLGQVVYKIKNSELWRDISQVKSLPQTIIKDTELEEFTKSLGRRVDVDLFKEKPVMDPRQFIASEWTQPTPTEPPLSSSSFESKPE